MPADAGLPLRLFGAPRLAGPGVERAAATRFRVDLCISLSPETERAGRAFSRRRRFPDLLMRVGLRAYERARPSSTRPAMSLDGVDA